MILIGLVILAVAPPPPPAGTSSASLAVSATVVRPVEISELVLTTEGATIVIRNTERVTVSVDGGAVRQADRGTMIVELDRNAVRTITLTY